MIQTILVTCIGNICRSPIGQVMLKSQLSPHFPQVVVQSAGLAALVDYPADPMALELMHERGLDLSTHRARQLSSDLVFNAELILTMTLDQKERIERQFPRAKGRVHRLGKWSGFDVPDPFQRPKIIFEQALLLIEQGVSEWYNKLWA